MLFDFFKNKPAENNENDDILARISYVITKNSKSTIVDVELENYDEKCIQALCNIISVLSDNKSLSETVEIIKDAMISDGQQDKLIQFFSFLDLKTKTKLLQSGKDVDEPCIKPSEVFLK